MYKFKYGGREGEEYTLVEAKDLVVVRTEEAHELNKMDMSSESKALVPNLLPVASFPEANVKVYKVVNKDPNHVVSLRNAVRKHFKKEDGIKFAGRVLKDQKTGTLFIYTENFFVKFKDDVSESRCKELLEKHQLLVKEKLVFAINAFFTEAESGTGMKIFEIAQNLLEEEDVEVAHPEMVREKKDKGIYPMQWHLKRTIINGTVINQHVDLEEAWKVSKGANTTIAVIDDGVDSSHEEFEGRIVAPRDTIRNLNNADPKSEEENHGTACAGVACAAGNFKAAGVSPESMLIPIRSGGLGSMSEAKAFAWAADNGADVISCSWGPRDGAWWNPGDPLHTSFFALPDSTRMAIDYAINTGRGGKGCAIIWAAGNGNEDVRYDGYASYEKVIAVAACNDRGRRSVYSDFGKAVWCAFPSSDIHVPEWNRPRPLTAGIWTTDREGRDGYNEGGINAESFVGDAQGKYTATFGGTSSACPGVAGVAALIYSINPELKWDQLKEILKNSCDRIDEENVVYDENGHNIFYGYGRLNAHKAVQNALATTAEAELEEFDIEGTAFFSRDSEVAILENTITEDDFEENRFLGFRLKLKPFHPDLSLKYKVNINNKGFTDEVTAGEFAGTTDKRRKLIGFSIELTGALADQYDVIYEAEIRNRTKMSKALNGEICGTDKKKGQAIKEIRIEVKKK
ncbi:MAG: S8 family serine peptidase [Bacteroidota bacterium]